MTVGHPACEKPCYLSSKVLSWSKWRKKSKINRLTQKTAVRLGQEVHICHTVHFVFAAQDCCDHAYLYLWESCHSCAENILLQDVYVYCLIMHLSDVNLTLWSIKNEPLHFMMTSFHILTSLNYFTVYVSITMWQKYSTSPLMCTHTAW